MKKRSDPTINQENLRIWLYNKIGVLISQPMVSKILNNQDVILNNKSIKPKQKRNTKAKFPILEQLLSIWIENMQGKIPLTIKLIKTKAQFIHSNILNQNNIKFTASNGWFNRFKNRFNIKKYRHFGEAGGIKEEYINKELPKLNSITRQYSQDDIYTWMRAHYICNQV
jgi:hypothetical protein